jgi:hypothetical protein
MSYRQEAVSKHRGTAQPISRWQTGAGPVRVKLRHGCSAPTGSRNGNFRHGRYTKEVAATRRWIQEARELLGKLK